MAPSHTETDDRDGDQPQTAFQKAAAATEGDTLTVLDERLRVTDVRRSAASRTLFCYGAHESTDQAPRYEIHVDARTDVVEIVPTDRTDTHVERIEEETEDDR